MYCRRTSFCFIRYWCNTLCGCAPLDDEQPLALKQQYNFVYYTSLLIAHDNDAIQFYFATYKLLKDEIFFKCFMLF